MEATLTKRMQANVIRETELRKENLVEISKKVSYL